MTHDDGFVYVRCPHCNDNVKIEREQVCPNGHVFNARIHPIGYRK